MTERKLSSDQIVKKATGMDFCPGGWFQARLVLCGYENRLGNECPWSDGRFRFCKKLSLVEQAKRIIARKCDVEYLDDPSKPVRELPEDFIMNSSLATQLEKLLNGEDAS